MNNPTEHKLQVLTAGLKFLEIPNSLNKQALLTLISEHGKMYHIKINTLKSAKMPLINSLVNFSEGLKDMQTLLNELNHSVK